MRCWLAGRAERRADGQGAGCGLHGGHRLGGFGLAALWVWVSLLLWATPAMAEPAVAVESLRMERSEAGLLLSASVSLQLPGVVEDAVYKGVPLVFVARAELVQPRWYWTDRRVRVSDRHMRLAYQPLSRKWRVQLGSGPPESGGLGLSLSQSYDTLEQALGAVRRVSGWRVAEPDDIEPGERYSLTFTYRLDTTQLPRPLQIGVLGRDDWNLDASITQPVPDDRGR